MLKRKEKLISGKYIIEKEIISTDYHIPVFNIDVIYEMHYVTIIGDNYNKDKSIFDDDNVIFFSDYLEIDLSDEMRRFCPNPEEQKFYYFNKIVDKKTKTELPLFYGVLFSNDHQGDKDDPPVEWKIATSNQFKKYVMLGYLKDESHKYDLFHFRHEIGGYTIELIYHLKNNYSDGCFETAVDKISYLCDLAKNIHNVLYEEFDNGIVVPKLDGLNCLATKYYLISVIEDFYKYIKDNKTFSICENCNMIYPKRDGKKYCSLNCLKSAANKRNYRRRKKKGAEKKK